MEDHIEGAVVATFGRTVRPTAELVMVAGADHIIVLNRPREVGDAIEGFLNRIAEAAQNSARLHEVKDYLQRVGVPDRR